MKAQHFIYCLAVVAACFTACKKEITETYVPVTGITLNYEELTLAPRDTITLIAIVQPDSATNKEIIWASSDTMVATIDSKGMVTAIVDGKASIIATTKNGRIASICPITVDYRIKWAGDWDFVSRDYYFSYGWERWDTTYFSGKISLENTPNYLKIAGWRVYVTENGDLFGFDDPPCGGFSGNDKVHMYFSGGLLNGTEKWSTDIYGTKKKEGKRRSGI